MSLPVYKTKLISPATCGRGSFTATSGRGPFTATCGRDSFLFSPRPVLGGCLPRTNSDCNLVRDPLGGGPNVTNAFYIAPTPRGGGFSFVLFYSPRAVGVCPVVTTPRGGDHLSRTNLGLIGAGSFRAQPRNLLKKLAPAFLWRGSLRGGRRPTWQSPFRNLPFLYRYLS